MKTIVRTLLALAITSVPVFAADLVNMSGASKVAVAGCDPVVFFLDAKPVNGLPFIGTADRGATCNFASEEHKRLFTQSPDRFAPQYGGLCTFGVGLDALFPVDFDTRQVRNGKLYLNLNSGILAKFSADFEGNVAKAEKNWPGLVTNNAK